MFSALPAEASERDVLEVTRRTRCLAGPGVSSSPSARSCACTRCRRCPSAVERTGSGASRSSNARPIASALAGFRRSASNEHHVEEPAFEDAGERGRRRLCIDVHAARAPLVARGLSRRGAHALIDEDPRPLPRRPGGDRRRRISVGSPRVSRESRATLPASRNRSMVLSSRCRHPASTKPRVRRLRISSAQVRTQRRPLRRPRWRASGPRRQPPCRPEGSPRTAPPWMAKAGCSFGPTKFQSVPTSLMSSMYGCLPPRGGRKTNAYSASCAGVELVLDPSSRTR